MKRQLCALDYETNAITARPAYPPIPVSAAYQIQGQKPVFLSWGHPHSNNTDKTTAQRIIRDLVREFRIVYHNSAFDLEVGHRYLRIPIKGQQYEDTMFLAFLDNPRGLLSLKSLANDHLEMPPDEQTDLKDWITTHVKQATPRKWGAYIANAPAHKVEPYAKGDVERTLALYHCLEPSIEQRGMVDAYRRELALVPIIMKMEQQGIPVDVVRLEHAVEEWTAALHIVDAKLRHILDEPISFNPGSGAQLANSLDRHKLVDHWIYTAPSPTYPHGQRSTQADVLADICKDQRIALLIKMRSMLKSSINTFAKNWLAQARETGGVVLPRFNQVRSHDDWNTARHGTRTGRLSSEKPNFQNITNPYDAKDPEALEVLHAMRMLVPGFQPPCLRDYVVPLPGQVILGRDYNQQELRILAHYEDGLLMERYNLEPNLDVHTFVQQLVAESTGVLYPRKHIKVTNFGIIYGMGAGKLARRLDMEERDARTLIRNVKEAIPGIKRLSSSLDSMGRDGDFIRTWGGRLYDSEPPRNGRRFEYKLLNVLIQGSAADCTKQAMIQVQQACNHAKLMLQVHDELLMLCEQSAAEKEMHKMKEAMESVNFDVPMLSDGKMSDFSWFRMK